MRHPVSSEQRLRLSGVSFSTRVFRSGTGAPVLLLHGSPDSAAEWLAVMDAVGPGFQCFAPDLPGLGECEEPPESFDYSQSATDAFLDAVLAGLAVEQRLVLVVHDIGGAIGVPWAARNVQRIQGVVITNTVVFEQFPWFALAKVWGRTDALGRAVAWAVMKQFGWFGGRIFRKGFSRISPELTAADLDRITREFAVDAKSKRCTLRLFRRMLQPSYFQGADAQLAELIRRVPVRVVWGEGDPYIPARYGDAFPGAECEGVSKGGHWVPLSAAERVAAAVRGLAGPRTSGRQSSPALLVPTAHDVRG